MDDQLSTFGFAFLTPGEESRVSRVRLPSGVTEIGGSFAASLLMLEWNPFASLEVWNGEYWETVWNGAVEFAGIAPERD